MANEFYTVLTETGLAKIAAAQAAGSTLTLAKMHVGTGGGSNYYTIYTQARLIKLTSLVDKKWEGALNDSYIDKDNPNWVVLEGVVPTNIGGWMIREIGITDTDGDLIAVGRFPETFKPLLTDGAAQELVLRSIMEISNTANVNLSIDPSVVLATREWVDQHKVDKSQIGDAGDKLPTNAISDKRYMHEGTPIRVSGSQGRAVSFKKIESEADVDLLLLNPIDGNGKYVLQGTFYFGVGTGASVTNRSSALLEVTSNSRAASDVAISGLLTANSPAGLDDGGVGGSDTQISQVHYQGSRWLALHVKSRSSNDRADIFKDIAFSGIFAVGALEWISAADLDIDDGETEPTITPILTRENNWQPTSHNGAFMGRPGDQIGNNTAWHSGNTLVDSNGFIKQA